MTTVMTDPPSSAPRDPKGNRLGLLLKDYQGAESTLCAGCGHDAITSSIVKAFFEMGVEPYRVAKLSGIGCSSKTTNYFMGQAHGINSVHGRMGAVATGASLANRRLVNIGISGDGDTASIGLSHFLHMVRRNVPIIYVIENNGCYGLTKGQFSATADRGSVKKGGLIVNQSLPIDCCALAIQMGCGFVARTFSGDTKQVRTLLKAAIAYRGTAVLDIVSPCVTFNNHEGSTKSVAYARGKRKPASRDWVCTPLRPDYRGIRSRCDQGGGNARRLHDHALEIGPRLRFARSNSRAGAAGQGPRGIAVLYGVDLLQRRDGAA